PATATLSPSEPERPSGVAPVAQRVTGHHLPVRRHAMTAAIGLVLFALGAGGPSNATPVDAARQQLGGTWVYVGGNPEREARKEALAETTRGMSFFIRGAAGKRIDRKTPIAERSKYDFPPGFIESWAQGAMTFHTPENGSPVTVEIDREPIQVAQFLRGGSLVQTFKGKDGVRT